MVFGLRGAVVDALKIGMPEDGAFEFTFSGLFMEEMFAGKVIELGTRHNVPTPVNQKLFDMIKEIEGNIN